MPAGIPVHKEEIEVVVVVRTDIEVAVEEDVVLGLKLDEEVESVVVINEDKLVLLAILWDPDDEVGVLDTLVVIPSKAYPQT